MPHFYSFISWWTFGWFPLFGCCGQRTVSVDVQLSVGGPDFSSLTYVQEIAGSYSNSRLNFSRNRFPCTFLQWLHHCILPVSTVLALRFRCKHLPFSRGLVCGGPPRWWDAWFLPGVLICISPASSEVGQPFPWSLAVCRASLETCLFKVFVYCLKLGCVLLKIGLCMCRGSWEVMNRDPFSDRYFLPFRELSFHSPMISILWCTEAFNTDAVQLVHCAFGVLSKKSPPNRCPENFPLCFLLKALYILALTFKSWIHFKLIFRYGVREESSFILWHVDIQSQHHLLRRLFVPPLNGLGSFVQIHWL